MSVAVAQDPPPPSAALQPAFAVPPYKNLKIFPQTISRADLIFNMKFFAQSLGVRCTFCHVGVEGQPLSTYDFASDAKEKKLKARKMLAMAHKINSENFDDAEDPGVLKVTCYTCHRGSTKPLTAPPAAPAPGSVPSKPANNG
jgi:photosynthetic reaction center cytochrome c subunit